MPDQPPRRGAPGEAALPEAATACGPCADPTQRRRALDHLSRARDEAALDGVAPDAFAMAALFVALADLAGAYGEEAVADFAARLPARVESGEFSPDRRLQ